MFQEVDEVLRQLLIRDIPVKNGEVDIVFDQPKREWSARLTRPTLNIFLHNIHENLQLRHSQQWLTEQNKDGTVTQRRSPVRVNLHYLITAWANEPEDEHNLLARSLMVLFRQPHLPEELLPESLQDQAVPVRILVAQEESTLRNLADIWSTLDNELKAGITVIVTLTLDPYLPLVTPLVSSVETRVGQTETLPDAQQLRDDTDPDVFWTVGGAIITEKSLDDLELRLVDRGMNIPIRDEGWFAINNLKAGDYTLEVKVNGGKPIRKKITVPSPDYNLEI